MREQLSLPGMDDYILNSERLRRIEVGRVRDLLANWGYAPVNAELCFGWDQGQFLLTTLYRWARTERGYMLYEKACGIARVGNGLPFNEHGRSVKIIMYRKAMKGILIEAYKEAYGEGFPE